MLQPRCPHEIWPWIKPTSNRTFFSCWERAMTVKKCGERSREGVQRVGLWLREQTKAAFSHDAWSCSQKRGVNPWIHLWKSSFSLLIWVISTAMPQCKRAFFGFCLTNMSPLGIFSSDPSHFGTRPPIHLHYQKPSIFWGVKNNDDNIPMASL